MSQKKSNSCTTSVMKAFPKLQVEKNATPI